MGEALRSNSKALGSDSEVVVVVVATARLRGATAIVRERGVGSNSEGVEKSVEMLTIGEWIRTYTLLFSMSK